MYDDYDCVYLSGRLLEMTWLRIMTFHEPHEMLPKEKKVKIPLPKKSSGVMETVT